MLKVRFHLTTRAYILLITASDGTETLSSFCCSLNVSAVGPTTSILRRRFGASGFRAGAATSHYLLNQNVSRTLWCGRWASAQTLRHYLQLGVYFASALHLGDATRMRLNAYGATFDSFMVQFS